MKLAEYLQEFKTKPVHYSISVFFYLPLFLEPFQPRSLFPRFTRGLIPIAA